MKYEKTSDDLWIDEMHKKYHHLFATFEGEETDRPYYTKGQILRGVECSRGWKKWIEKFLESLEWLTENRRYIKNPDYNPDIEESRTNKQYIEGPKRELKIFQIKEKFGEIRVYMENYPEDIKADIHEVIAKLEARTELTCYSCGKVEEDLIQTKGWISFICKECFDKRNSKKEEV